MYSPEIKSTSVFPSNQVNSTVQSTILDNNSSSQVVNTTLLNLTSLYLIDTPSTNAIANITAMPTANPSSRTEIQHTSDNASMTYMSVNDTEEGNATYSLELNSTYFNGWTDYGDMRPSTIVHNMTAMNPTTVTSTEGGSVKATLSMGMGNTTAEPEPMVS